MANTNLTVTLRMSGLQQDQVVQLFGFNHFYRVTRRRADNSEAIDSYSTLLENGEIGLTQVDCPNCSANNDQLVFNQDRYGIPWKTVICRDCGMLYSNPQMDAQSTIEFYASDHYRKIYGSGQLLRDSTARYEIDNVDRSADYHRLIYYEFIVEAGIDYESVAEIGAGGGWNLVPFIEDGKQCVGYDYSPALVESGRQHGIDMIRADQQEMVGEHDLILMKHVLEHLGNPVQYLHELREHISDGGHLFIEVPGIVNNIPSIQNAHYHYFSKRTLASAMRQAGFEIINIRIIERNGDILVLAKKSMDFASADIDPVEYKRVIDVVKRGRRAMVKGLVADHLPDPIVSLIQTISRG